ncbi:MAG: NAD(P)-dependent oxidoreductase [Thermoleophilia bacterium]|nr:NAD(P)-dependent oxidoreductase [Thermoleophilia bacterium]
MIVGVVGAGLMGTGMIRQLAAAGFDVRVFARTPARAEGLPATMQPDVATAADGADVVLLSVTDSDDVLDVVAAIMSAPTPPPLIIDTSTIAPAAAEVAAAIARAGGSEYLDCPVSGGPTGAAAGTLAVMCGGTDAGVAAAAPVLDCIGDPAKRVYCGPVGSGLVAKLVNNLLVAVITAGTAEAFGVGQRAGVSPDVLARAVMASSGDSWQLRNLFPRVLAGDHRPGFRVRDLVKDLGHARMLAGVPLTVGDAAAALFGDLDGSLDYGAVARLLMDLPDPVA